ncbi:hypothetical protein FJV41_34795 [Myxococcus llanfairpwllgwyngyllgogerychwyrndrobwllllantysiliogogogochensis]|uniref:Outer membrane protein beta-barrel domain-containing protein n=1 Tax=Myxococcus llanfairpwllgwyngyllgogerychwyrndrobwllllantysiliogogogochensis TaxID=2590453 RepID=A0A540WQP4_9BACT|nr:hypothetical protein [Myxococcus llanfairpwllgwyngyllgogerychwyrndrobwllllantysiliogogogochensis]TQF11338.1 hypothetical protein FJV41_34795 [Myxococcus llanfairpwllgwyngyllgogerychwyrndrobwllllantysiliogogogochensis]
MPSFQARWCAGLLLGLLLAVPAEARFGKRSKPSESTSDTHEATAIGKEDDADDDDKDSDSDGESSDSGSDDCCSDSLDDLGNEVVGSVVGWMLQGMVHAIANTGTHLNQQVDASLPPGVATTELSTERRHAVPVSFRMGAQNLLWRGDAKGADMFVGLEFRRFGVEGHVLRLSLPTDDGSEGRDRLTLVEGHVTHAFLVREHLRLRAEAGVSTAYAPDVMLVGPSVGVSFEACVLGPLDLEARTQLTPWPYLQVDGTVGLALHLGSLMLRGGWRGVYLDDQGTVDGVAHQDRLHGPYLGAGLTF